ncbi:hypothetical protein Ahu01nite_087070 [Winogradskya humida]|uniref:Uncharacterized protein n=1 Tax=Winogradskya humida TaxID=113566 RepID=A0ABQ4A427_9ACTN|nr:hypothetical protein Ahu01nite_087070 [Actinoplanes humidus]
MSSWAFECYQDEMAPAGADVVDISAQHTEVDENIGRRFNGLANELGHCHRGVERA